MLTVYAESALLLMSDSQGPKILMIDYRELVIHSNLVVICEYQNIDVVERTTVLEVRLCLWTYNMNLYVQLFV